MERIQYSDGFLPQACFMCPARVCIGGENWCDKGRLNDKSLNIKVARYKPNSCSKSTSDTEGSESPEILLRQILGK